MKRQREIIANVVVTQKYALISSQELELYLLISSRQGYMFWSDVTARTISRAKLDGSEVTVLVNSGLSTVGKGGRSP